MTDTEDQKSFLTVHRDPPVSAHPDALDYDPNYFADAKNVVRLTLGSWRHRGYVLVTIGGNCKGVTILEYAMSGWIDDVMEYIEQDGGFGEDGTGVWGYVFYDANGDELSGEVFGDERDVRDRLERMVLGAEIIELSGPEVEAARARRREFEAREARES